MSSAQESAVSGLMMLVPGTAVAVEDQGVLIMGPPKSGKSSVAYGLLREPNTRLVSDRSVIVREYDDGLWMGGGEDYVMHLPPDLHAIFPEFIERHMSVEDIASFPIADLVQESTQPGAILSLCLFVEWAPSRPTALVFVDPDACRALVGPLVPDGWTTATNLWSTILKRTPCYRLDLGADWVSIAPKGILAHLKRLRSLPPV